MTEFETATLAINIRAGAKGGNTVTEFEAATIAFQRATLAVQQGSLELQQSQLWAAIAIPVVAGLVGLLQAGVVIYGIRAMIRVNEGRAEADRQRAEAEVARHAEAMARIDQQGETLRAVVQGLDQQGETLRAVVQGLERQGAALERQGAALEAALRNRA